VIALRGVRAGYGGSDALHGVDLTLEPGEVVALLGENGAGKSTLLKVFAGLLRPHAGAVTLGGRSLSEVPRREAAQRIGYLPQAFAPLFPMRALDAVLLGRTPWLPAFGAPSPGDVAAAWRALAEVDAEAFAGTDLLEMSGGERQRVLLARVFAGGPKVLLLDEPASNLDPRHRLLVMDALRRRATEGAAVLFSAHEIDLAASAADRAVLLSAGRVAAAGAVAEVLTAPLLSELFGVSATVTPGPGGRPVVSLASRLG
jgi:iron complex transport system ATP-binding protein